jgi:sec-independent protein translocase protein TatA
MGLSNPLHIMILALVVLLVFGAKRLPEIGRSLGEGMRGFKDTIQGGPESGSLDHAAPAPTLHAATTAGSAGHPAAPAPEPQPAPTPAVYAVPSQPVDSAA